MYDSNEMASLKNKIVSLAESEGCQPEEMFEKIMGSDNDREEAAEGDEVKDIADKKAIVVAMLKRKNMSSEE